MAETVIMPKTGMAMEEGIIVEWLKREGDEVAVGDILAHIETDKSTMDLESDSSGTLLKLLYEAGTTVPVTVPIAWIGKKGEKIPETSAQEKPKEEEPKSVEPPVGTVPPSTDQSPGKILSTPAAKRIAEERKIDLSTVTPSGKWGEIVQKDVLPTTNKGTSLTTTVAEDKHLKGEDSDGYSRVPLTNVQKITGKRMVESVSNIPMVTEDIKADMTRLLELKQAILNESGLKASVNDFIIKATAKALTMHPKMNSVFDGDALIQKHDINIGMAVATNRGLLVPVIRRADTLTLSALVEKTRTIIQRTREEKLTPEEFAGSTFSISNVGMYGITAFTPIINPPEAGILGVCAIEKVPRIIDGTLTERSVMILSLTFDHRIVDGAESAQFLQSIVSFLEQPLKLIV